MTTSTNGAERDMYDITIIGAGPTGLFAAFYAGMRKRARRSSIRWKSRVER